MKIYIPTYTKNIHTEPNPFCYTLMDEITKKHPEVEVISDWHFFWSDEVFSVDIVHVMWPQFVLKDGHSANQIKERYLLLKKHNVRIIATCHNILPHYSENKDEILSYKLTYQNAEVIIHLGSYSKDVFSELYPNAKHLIIPHHVYDTIYKEKPSREKGLEILGMNPMYHYILSIGEFRDEEERGLINVIEHAIEGTDIRIISPMYLSLQISKRKHPIKYLKRLLNLHLLKYRMPNLICSGHFVPDHMLPAYYAVSDVCFIQRKKILNSGNLPMALYMKNVVVGPDVGNVGLILKETGNPSFNPDDRQSILNAFYRAMELSSSSFPIKNRDWAIANCTTSKCAEAYYSVYKNENLNNYSYIQ